MKPENKEIEKVIGRAGTGKTTYMISKLSELYNCGVSPLETGMVTFTRVAAEVFTSRSLKNFKQFNVKQFKNFGTMNSLTARLIEWKKENAYTSEKRRQFVLKYYPESILPLDDYPENEYHLTQLDKDNISNNSIFKAFEGIYQTMEGLMIYDFDFYKMEILTGKTLEYREKYVTKKIYSEKHDKYVLVWNSRKQMLNPKEVILFCKNFNTFKEDNNILEYSDTIKQCIEQKVMLNVKHLFVDEFQDFNKLQFALYQMWRDNPFVESVHIAGDDAQTISRFGGANSNYFISTPSTIKTILPKTYRHGKLIFNNAQKYIDKMIVVEECDVLPHDDIDGEIVDIYGDAWIEAINFKDDESVLILAWSKDMVSQIKKVLGEKCKNIYFASLGNESVEKRVLEQYNTISKLERGEIVEWEFIKNLFSNDKTCIQSKMLVKETTTTLMGSVTELKNKVVIKSGIKKQIKDGSFDNLDNYNKKTFEEHFLNIKWNGKLILNNLKDINLFEAAQDTFPEHAAQITNKRIGTIHKSKGDEADTVILFMAVPYPAIVSARKCDEGKDDIMHVFYVGTTRPKTKLIEVYNYFDAPAPMDVV